ALRACCSLIQIWAGHRLHIEMYRLVFASHQSTSRACHRLPTPHRQKHPITKHDSGAIAMMGAMTEMLSSGEDRASALRVRERSLRRRRRFDLRTLATGVALFVA